MPSQTQVLGPVALVATLLVGPSAARGQFAVGSNGQLALGSPTSIPAATSRLAATARRLTSTVRAELAGTSLGRRLEIRANALQGAAQSLDAAVRGGATPDELRPSLAAVDAAAAQVQAVLNAAPGAAPQSALLAAQIDDLTNSLRRMIGGVVPIGPIGPGPGGLEYDAGTIIQQAESARSRANALATTIATQVGWVEPYDRAIRDLRGLSAQLAALRDQARRSNPLTTLQAGWASVRGRSAGLAASLRGVRPPPAVVSGLNALQADLDALAGSLGISPGYVVDPDRPSLLEPPAYGGLPYPIVPPTIPPWPYDPPVVRLIDQALGEVDAFLLGIRPHLGTIPEGPRFQADAVALRNDLLDLRQRVLARDAGPSRAAAFARVDRSYRRLADRTARIAKGRYGPNIARVDSLGTLIGRILREPRSEPS
jgi:hypothetical protein